MSGGEVVYSGWLRKSPPEKKLRRYAWKKRWFILRSGRMSGDPDVLEYYKNDHAKKPIRVINLSCCEQVDAGLTFNKKELQDSYVFDIKTSDRTFYLVAETEEEMNKWVRSICQICGFNQSEENSALKVYQLLEPHTFFLCTLIFVKKHPNYEPWPRSSPAEFSSTHHLLRERKSSAPVHSSQPLLFTFESPSNHVHQTTLSASAPQDYLFLHQCMSRKTENMRSASFSQATRTSFFLCVSDTAVQKLAQGYGHCLNGVSGQVHASISLPKPSRINSELRDSAYDLPRSFGSLTQNRALRAWNQKSEDVYSYKTPSNALCKEFNELSRIPTTCPGTPMSVYQIPRTFTLDKNHNAFGENTLLQWRTGVIEQTKSSMPRSESADSEDNYVPHEPGSSSQFNAEKLNDNTQNAYIPMSPGPHHFDFPGFSATLPARKGSTALYVPGPTRVSARIQPPPLNRNLKPDRKAKPTPLDLRGATIIDELPFQITCYKILGLGQLSTQSITSTSSGDSEENYVAMRDYLALDFQPCSPSPHRKPSTSSVASDEKVDYVQVDQEKTQALQNNHARMWKDVRQSSEPAKD
ncbi:LOW QUALITY PROTEIN: GRB2-associated-binding protein 2 [Discoglossus pictus]